MSQTLDRVRALVASGQVRTSVHGSRELAADGILLDEVTAGVASAMVVEDSPDYHKGPCVLVLQRDAAGRPIHVLWGIPKDRHGPAVVITSYRPDPQLWSADFLKRGAP